jgi:hypothetical protein
MNKVILNEIYRMNELMGFILEQSLSDVQSGNKVIQKGSKGDKASQATGDVKDFFSGFMSVFENYLRNEKLLYERPLDERLVIMEYNSRKKLILK